MKKKKLLGHIRAIRKKRKAIYEHLISDVQEHTLEKMFEEVYQAKIRVNERLGNDGAEDTDIEIIINKMFDISKKIGYKMYTIGYLENE